MKLKKVWVPYWLVTNGQLQHWAYRMDAQNPVMQSIFFVNRRTLTRNAEASLTSCIMCWNLLMNGDSELVLALEMLHTACNSRLCSGITWYFWEPLFLMSIVKKGIDVYLNIKVVHRMSTAQKHIFVTTLNTVAVFLRSCTFPVRTSKRMSLLILDDINRPVRSNAVLLHTFRLLLFLMFPAMQLTTDSFFCV